MKSQDRYFIGPGLRDKLRDMVRAHDSAFLGDGAGEIPTRLQDMPRGGQPIRLGTISLSWSKGSTATVTQVRGDGTAIDPAVTFEAKNWFATISVPFGTKKVACAKVDATWILIAAECE